MCAHSIMDLIHLFTALSLVIFTQGGKTCPGNCRLSADFRPSEQKDTYLCHPTTGECISGCMQGWWGRKCQRECSSTCKGHICLQTGQCIKGCVQEYYGLRCNNICHRNCLFQSCHQNGSCIYGCVDGHYGDMCELSCGINCLSQRCESVLSVGTYKCSHGCVDGWKGSTCQQKCPVHCLSCHALFEGCISCQPGWSGFTCTRPVLDQCKTSMVEAGNCTGGCHDGFQGPRCEEKCPDFCLRCDQDGGRCTLCHPGRYGIKCEGFCPDCEQGLCQADNGDCMMGKLQELQVADKCKQHDVMHYYNSTYCARHRRNKRHIMECRDHCRKEDCSECDLGWYGDRCREFCPQNCFNGCGKTNGKCDGCRPNFYGSKCQEKCPYSCRKTEEGHVVCDDVSGECLSGCISGHHGLMCNLTCPAHCKGNICTQSSGECTNGCSDGWIWNHKLKECRQQIILALKKENRKKSSLSCREQYYGMNCEQNCSSSCNNSICTFNKVTNTLFCTKGCIDGRFGPYCESRCRVECESCEDYDHCTRCRPGFHGPTCSDFCSIDCNGCRCHQNGSCSDGCIEGHYGQNCSGHCEFNCLKCDQQSGRCLRCMPNWCGEKCDQMCFGCKFGLCTHKLGSCPLGCNPGLEGPQCNMSAHLNTLPCFTSEGSALTGRTKRHTCEYGCLTSECTQCWDGFYGNSCEKKCPEHCEGTCNKTDGHCDHTCKAGFFGSYCNVTCPENCRTTCDQISGYCHGGCRPNWHGFDCTKSCPERCQPAICYQHSGQCTKGCADGWQGSTCSLKCPDGCQDRLCNVDGTCKKGCKPNFVGAFRKCSISCSPNCLDGACNITEARDGYNCTKGCKDGFAGDFCNIECAKKCLSCDRFNTDKCKICTDGLWGDQCQHQCQKFCSCERKTGKCTKYKRETTPSMIFVPVFGAFALFAYFGFLVRAGYFANGPASPSLQHSVQGERFSRIFKQTRDSM